MSKKVIQTTEAPPPIGPYSQAIESQGFLFCSGQIPLDAKTGMVLQGDIREQTQLVMKNIEAVLKAAGLGFDAVVKTTIFLTDMADFPAVNEVYGKSFANVPPARSTVAVAGLPRGVNVEIEVLAAAKRYLVATEIQTESKPRGSGLNRFARFLALAFALSAVLLIWTYVREMRLILAQPMSSWTQDDTADCAVVLTGGPNRIREGIDLLERHAVQKLIISGVHPQSGLRDILQSWPFYGDLRDQDVVLERRSRSTYGNAQQSLPIVEALRCRDILLITSRTHMRRAYQTFHAEFPSTITITPRPVVAYTIEPSYSELSIEALKSLFYSVWAY